MAIRKTAAKIRASTTTAPTVTARLVGLLIDPSPAPTAPAKADSVVVASTARPAVATSSRLRPRAVIGFGRRWRGTAQATFIPFCSAWATPSAP